MSHPRLRNPAGSHARLTWHIQALPDDSTPRRSSPILLQIRRLKNHVPLCKFDAQYLLVVLPQHLASHSIHEMHLSASQTRHGLIGRVFVAVDLFGEPTLHVQSCCWTSVNKRSHSRMLTRSIVCFLSEAPVVFLSQQAEQFFSLSLGRRGASKLPVSLDVAIADKSFQIQSLFHSSLRSIAGKRNGACAP
jgi:hypothetical protein